MQQKNLLKVNLNRSLVWLLAVMLAFITGCATVALPNHKFDFRPRADRPDVRVLDWKYSVWNPQQWEKDSIEKDGTGHWGANVTGNFPVGEFIYVKWQVPPDPTIYERRIELKGLLPWSMEGRELRLSFDHNEPVVYLISPDKSEPGFVSFRGRGYSLQRIEQIHPGPIKRITSTQSKN